MNDDKPSAGPRWIILATALCGLVAAVFFAATKYYEYQKARREAASGNGSEKRSEAGPGNGEAKTTTAPFHEDFAKVAEGTLPTGWTGDDAISVRRGDDRARLEVGGEKSNKAVTTPKLAVTGDFFLQFEAFLDGHREIDLTLLGKDGGRDLTLKIVSAVILGGGGVGVEVGLADLERVPTTKNAADRLFRVRLERRGTTHRVLVNGETVIARPVTGHAGFAAVKLTLSGEPPLTRFYSLEVGPLPAEK